MVLGDNKCKFTSRPLSDFSASAAACAVGLKGEKWILLGFIRVDLSSHQKEPEIGSPAALFGRVADANQNLYGKKKN